jgi:hypothetical protein
LKTITITTITQCNRQALPKLDLGANHITVDYDPEMQYETLSVRPLLKNDLYQRYAVDWANIGSSDRQGSLPVIFADSTTEEAHLTFQLDAPRPILKFRMGGSIWLSGRAESNYVRYEYRFRGADGQWDSWQSAGKFDYEHTRDNYHQRRNQNKYLELPVRQAEVNGVQFRYVFRTSHASKYHRTGASLLRTEVDYQAADTSLTPIEVTYNWTEYYEPLPEDESGGGVRSHTERITKLPHRYHINVGGHVRPHTNWVRMNLQGSSPEAATLGCSDGKDVGDRDAIPPVGPLGARCGHVGGDRGSGGRPDGRRWPGRLLHHVGRRSLSQLGGNPNLDRWEPIHHPGPRPPPQRPLRPQRLACQLAAAPPARCPGVGTVSGLRAQGQLHLRAIREAGGGPLRQVPDRSPAPLGLPIDRGQRVGLAESTTVDTQVGPRPHGVLGIMWQENETGERYGRNRERGITMSRVEVSFVLTCVVAFSSPARAADESRALPQGNNGIASQYVDDVGIEKDPAVIYATGFENGITGGLKKVRSGVVILDDPSMARTGSACAQITAPRGKDSGGDLRYTWQESVEECFVRFYCRFHEDTVAPHHFVNLGGRMPTYKYRWGGGAGLRPPGGADGAFGTTIEPPRFDKPGSGWAFYTYWHEMHSWQTPHGASAGRPNAYYGNNFRPDNQRPFVGRGKWICVEFMVKMNTLGKHDGEQAFWIDGKKESTLQWYVSDRAAKEGKSDKNIVYFDNYVIATKYIGPVAEKEGPPAKAAPKEGGEPIAAVEPLWQDDFDSCEPRWAWRYSAGTGFKVLGDGILEAGVTDKSNRRVYSDCSLHEDNLSCQESPGGKHRVEVWVDNLCVRKEEGRLQRSHLDVAEEQKVYVDWIRFFKGDSQQCPTARPNPALKRFRARYRIEVKEIGSHDRER